MSQDETKAVDANTNHLTLAAPVLPTSLSFILRRNERDRFYRVARGAAKNGGYGLSLDEIHQACHVSDMRDFRGTCDEALRMCAKYIARRKATKE